MKHPRPVRDGKGKLLYDHCEVQLIEFAGRICANPCKKAVEREMGLAQGAATRMLKNPVVQKHIERIKRQIERAAHVTLEALLSEAWEVGGAPRGEVKDADKLAGIRLCGDLIGATKTKHELSGPDGGPIQTESAVRVYLPHNGRDKLPPVDEE